MGDIEEIRQRYNTRVDFKFTPNIFLQLLNEKKLLEQRKRERAEKGLVRTFVLIKVEKEENSTLRLNVERSYDVRNVSVALYVSGENVPLLQDVTVENGKQTVDLSIGNIHGYVDIKALVNKKVVGQLCCVGIGKAKERDWMSVQVTTLSTYPLLVEQNRFGVVFTIQDMSEEGDQLFIYHSHHSKQSDTMVLPSITLKAGTIKWFVQLQKGEYLAKYYRAPVSTVGPTSPYVSFMEFKI
ncbi:hypothetical protein EIN_095970 [Entamoeba invadens IP1]|uniref:Uncharacterized protein n=1 Tax=Entamoeba invadens IP1 TaxID=370355 RepID=A0A0A1U0C2_ENTIV|nr:hypothetical protein EIN_095970 [Entamoeba invadens IP1]ELP87340.1 hypothetical protein EIN_095970 [Entamoeba invadens IP1]|eukprot:XP_004254111.1 hypothetical protein EIN_095970 [Entamoeba invadens IP1]